MIVTPTSSSSSDAAEQLDTAEREDLRADRLRGDDGVNVAAQERGAMALGRQIDDLEIGHGKARAHESPAQEIGADGIHLHGNAPARRSASDVTSGCATTASPPRDSAVTNKITGSIRSPPAPALHRH